MLTQEEIAHRRDRIAESADLTRLLARLGDATKPLLHRMPPLPEAKALLSVDGGVCPADGAALLFDPWSQSAHRCPRCGTAASGERHDLHWARFQHLWLAERIAELAAVGVMSNDAESVARAHEFLDWYGARYHEFPNRDNVLGPSRLFFSTYLESVWLSNIMAAAYLLREEGCLRAATEEAVSTMAEEAANLIGEYNEGFSNRQTWNNAALTAVAVWFEDEALAQASVEGPTGLIAHLGRGYGSDGMWYEGENYHLFALRGLLTGACWARLAGVDLASDPPLAERLRRALEAPALTALPDATFPARKDARFGVSLTQPMYLELWEIGLAWLSPVDPDAEQSLGSWLTRLYHTPGQPAEPFESYLHEATAPRDRGNGTPRARSDLSWWMLLEMTSELPPEGEWQAGSVFLEGQGLAVFRSDARYVSVECGAYGGGHGHPDRLHLTLFADGILWLPDFGTGSYVADTLAWYRSTLAHNAPRLDGVSQTPGSAFCEAYDVVGDWAWVRGSYADLRRTVVAGPAYVLDIVEYRGGDRRSVELPWHFDGVIAFEAPPPWQPGSLSGSHVDGVEETQCRAGEPLVIEARAHERTLTAVFAFDGSMVRARGPGRPPDCTPTEFLVARAIGTDVRLVTMLIPGSGSNPTVPALHPAHDGIDIETTAGIDRHRPTADGWTVERVDGAIELRGLREPPPVEPPRLELEPPILTQATVPFVPDAPALDGTLDGFDAATVLALDHEDQYRRSEEPYPGHDALSALVYLNWNSDGLFVGVDVVKAEPIFRQPDAPALLLDNEVDDIHSDGIQVYLQERRGAPILGLLAVPEISDGAAGGAVRVRAVGGGAVPTEAAEGRWQRTSGGYCMTLRITPAWWESVLGSDRVRFDLVVNEMRPDRRRRAGQLVWTGGGGWVWLRGDRQDPERFGELELQA